jgi:SAM-dependent methyltransferase
MSTTTDTANVEQASAWDGDEGDHWTDHEDSYNAAVRRYDPHLFEAARIAPDDHVLDIGCGCGLSTRDAARIAVSGLALGVDLSARMIERARQHSRAEALTNARFERADAQVHPFDRRASDVVISRFGAMFFADPVAAFVNIGGAVRSGGRLALLSWQALRENEWLVAIREALAAGRTLPEPPAGAPGPFGLADPDGARRLLADAGFEDIALEAVSERLYLGADAERAFGFVSGLGITRGLLNDLDTAARTSTLEALMTTLAAHETAEGVLFHSSAWVVTAHRP